MSRPFLNFLSTSYACLFALALTALTAEGGIVAYEATSLFPEETAQGWAYTPLCTPDRWLDQGSLFQHVEIGCWPNDGEMDRYIRSLADFVDVSTFFIEFRVKTDGDQSEIPGIAPCSLVADGLFVVSYDFVISRDLVRFQRDDFVVTVFVEIDPDVPHTYRLELYGPDAYSVYIDGDIIDSGVPGGAYPSDENDLMAWSAHAWDLPNTTQWNYVRLGTIPQDASGDYDSDQDVDSDDFYFFEQYFSGPDADAGPGARFADFDFDTDVDCADWKQFLIAWTDPEDPPVLPACSGNPIPTVSESALILMTLLFLTAGAIVLRPSKKTARTLQG